MSFDDYNSEYTNNWRDEFELELKMLGYDNIKVDSFECYGGRSNGFCEISIVPRDFETNTRTRLARDDKFIFPAAAVSSMKEKNYFLSSVELYSFDSLFKQGIDFDSLRDADHISIFMEKGFPIQSIDETICNLDEHKQHVDFSYLERIQKNNGINTEFFGFIDETSIKRLKEALPTCAIDRDNIGVSGRTYINSKAISVAERVLEMVN